MENDIGGASNIRKPIAELTSRQVYSTAETTQDGLTEAEAKARLERFGLNVISELAGRPLILKFLANFTHLMAILLWIGSIVAFIAGMPQLGIAVIMVNIINGAFSFWQEYKAEKATEALRRLLPAWAAVLRNGDVRRIPAEELVPDDIMLLSEGNRISADGESITQLSCQREKIERYNLDTRNNHAFMSVWVQNAPVRSHESGSKQP